MIKIENFVPQVQLEVPSCPPLLIRDNIIESAILFCQQSFSWNDWIEHIGNKDDSEADLSSKIDDNKYPMVLIDVIKDNINIDVKDYKFDNGIVKFPEKLNGDITFDFRIAYQPKRDIDELPDWFYEEYKRTISSGTIWLLMFMTGQPWFNAEMAQYHYTVFQNGISKARVYKLRKNNNVETKKVQPRSFI